MHFDALDTTEGRLAFERCDNRVPAREAETFLAAGEAHAVITAHEPVDQGLRGLIEIARRCPRHAQFDAVRQRGLPLMLTIGILRNVYLIELFDDTACQLEGTLTVNS